MIKSKNKTLCANSLDEYLKFWDIFLTVFHDAFTIWNCLAWIIPKFRFLHFITINLTFISWIGLGYFYGWGYCFLTDYHYSLKYQLGEKNLPPSYIQLRMYEIFGILPSLELTNWVVGIVFSLVLILSYYFQIIAFFKSPGAFIKKFQRQNSS